MNHGVAVGACTATPRDDGSRIDYSLKAWPMEFVRWDATRRALMAQTFSGPEEEIVHGDGRWVVFRKHEIDPWKHGALLAAALVWARHAFALRDWAKGSIAHGNNKVVGEMPSGLALQKDDGSLTDEASAFLELLKSLSSDEAPVGIRPAGSKTDYLVNNSTAWQIFTELVLNADRAAARIYLGTDGTLGAPGGAPGVNIEALFGVATTRVQGDLWCIERGLLTGVIEPWTAINFGDSSLAPKRVYVVPDEDADAQRTSLAARRKSFYEDIAAAKSNGFDVTQDFVDALAEEYGITAPTLAVVAAATPAASSPPGPTGLRVVS